MTDNGRLPRRWRSRLRSRLRRALWPGWESQPPVYGEFVGGNADGAMREMDWPPPAVVEMDGFRYVLRVTGDGRSLYECEEA